MLPSLRRIAANIVGTEEDFTLSDIEGFPLEIYNRQQEIYLEAEQWFKGYTLNGSNSGSDKDLYPLKINPLISTVMKHAYVLFGETINDGRPLVYPKMIATKDTQKAKDEAKEAEDALNMLWWENNGRSLMFENGILSQIYGGCVFKATYVPWESIENGGWRQIPIRIERVHPRWFMGRPNAGDMYRLREGWIINTIPYDEAKKWGYTGYDDKPLFIEYWSGKKHVIRINKDEAHFPAPIPDMNDGQNPLSGENPFGFVPIVYIPHIRIGEFYGTNAFDHLKGIVKEINLRFGDYGDAVNDDSHIPLGMRDVQGSPMVKKIGEGLSVIDLGSSSSIAGEGNPPDLFEIRKTRASSSMSNLLNELVNQYRRDSFVPAVAEGEDEGSQRSALTLATRFWPLTSHAGTERIFFSDGLNVFDNYLLKMMAAKNLYGINENHTKMRIKQSWAPMLPRDREAEVQEWALRSQENLGSIEHLLTLTRDVEDIAQQREDILKWMEDVETVKAEAQAKAAQKYSVPKMPFENRTGEPGRPKEKQEKTTIEKRGGGGE